MAFAIHDSDAVVPSAAHRDLRRFGRSAYRRAQHRERNAMGTAVRGTPLTMPADGRPSVGGRAACLLRHVPPFIYDTRMEC